MWIVANLRKRGNKYNIPDKEIARLETKSILKGWLFYRYLAAGGVLKRSKNGATIVLTTRVFGKVHN